ncbi:MAG: hypothetical protein [Circular genetic element sp.]|jgi:hypothetical protein|nr:MAG: hypothetical protein [Circular genetic element sp.]
MRQIKTFNLRLSTIKDLNEEVRRGYRSKFVEDAIRHRLDGLGAVDLHDLTTIRIASHLRNARFSELTKLERTMLEDLIARLEESE